MDNRMVGIWMYQNGGGDVLQEKLVTKLRQHDYQTVTGLDLCHATANRDGIFCNGTNMQELALFFTYNAGQQSAQQVYMYSVLDGYLPIINNYAAFTLSEDKFMTQALLNDCSVPVTDFYVTPLENAEVLHEVLHLWGGKLVYKPVDGWGGRGLVKVETPEALDTLISQLRADAKYPAIYVERFVDYDGTDFRIDVVDGQFVGCYGRRAPVGEWRTNVTNGGTVFMREANDTVVDLACYAARVAGLDIAGVDLIYDREHEQYVVLEINGIPAFATPEQEQMGLDFNERKLDLIVALIDQKLDGELLA